MNPRALLADEDAQSEVLGAVLLVAVVVLVVGLIGSAVFGFGARLGAEQPRAEFAFDFNKSSTSSGCAALVSNPQNPPPSAGELNITHDGGSPIDGDQLYIDSTENDTKLGFNETCGIDPVVPGNGTSVLVDSDDTIRILWRSESGDRTIVLEKWSGPDS